jgi:hypothetical protein
VRFAGLSGISSVKRKREAETEKIDIIMSAINEKGGGLYAGI